MTGATPFLERPANLALIFAGFALVALPLAAVSVAGGGGWNEVASSPAVRLYMVVLGVTHFFLTFTVYLRVANLRHFASTPDNRAWFFAFPALALVGLWAWYGFGLSERFVLANTVIFLAIRGLDYYHLSRQSFGVAQMFKATVGGALPGWCRTAENAYFLSLAVQLFNTFLSDDFRFDGGPAAIGLATVSAALLVAIGVGYAMAARAGAPIRPLATGFAYIGLQTASAALAIAWSPLYFAALAVHYVEYHLLMGPRCFRGELDDAWPDRAFAAIRTPIRLYAVLLGLSGLWWLVQTPDGPLSGGPRALIHVFDGLFVFHYIVEIGIWRFSDPYFRKALSPLYFPRAG